MSDCQHDYQPTGASRIKYSWSCSRCGSTRSNTTGQRPGLHGCSYEGSVDPGNHVWGDAETVKQDEEKCTLCGATRWRSHDW